MAYENIKLRKRNFTIVDGYFWTMDNDIDSVVLKTDDGTIAFSYPLDTTISGEVLSMEYDGRNIWTLRNTGTNAYAIDRWYIKNYVCVLRNSFSLLSSASHTFSTEAFTVEHYHTAFTNTITPAGSTSLAVGDASQLESGYKVYLGPNVDGKSEEVSVSSADATTIYCAATTYAYQVGDPVSFYKRIWLFNNYNGTDGSTGAIYHIDAYTGSVVTKYAGGSYKDIKCCTFYGIPKYVFDRSTGAIDPRYNSLVYVKGNTMIFLNPNNFDESFGAMVLDNIKSDNITVIPVYGLSIEGTNVYRLQLSATYYGQTNNFSTYNYQLSTLSSFITSISLSAIPAILPANGVADSKITATVLDQFGLPIEGRDVTFTDDDSVGSITMTTVFTDANGQAVTYYIAGTSAREVRITASAQQT